jgi:serine/threonine protein kinase
MSAQGMDVVSSRYRERRPYTVGDVIDGRYELRRVLGRGASGVVFEALHRFTNRAVALKIVAPDVPRREADHLHQRLIREARALAAAHHPGIVDILDGGLTEDTPYIVLEMLKGRTLEGLLAARGPLSQENALGVALQLCNALIAAHEGGVVHRDLKPGNIFVVNDFGIERLKLVDFGIAQMQAYKQVKLTMTGAVLGTPEYMAPEQLLALDDVDARADVYAVGVTLYECLTGSCPYVGSYPELLSCVYDPTPPTSLVALRPEIGGALSAVIGRAIAKDRDARYQTMRELRQAIIAAVPHARLRTTLLKPQVPSVEPARAAAAVAQTASAPDPEPQRRRAQRAPYATPVHIIFPNGESIDGRNEDISTGGMLVLSRVPCDAGQRVLVRFALPIDGHVVSCPAEVRWVRASRADDAASPRAIGLEFAGASKQMTSAIARYVALVGDPNQT